MYLARMTGSREQITGNGSNDCFGLAPMGRFSTKNTNFNFVSTKKGSRGDLTGLHSVYIYKIQKIILMDINHHASWLLTFKLDTSLPAMTRTPP